jgi:hypothetical protein
MEATQCHPAFETTTAVNLNTIDNTDAGALGLHDPCYWPNFHD